MIVQLDNITFPGTTDSEGIIQVKQRLLIEENSTLQLTFEKYGNKYTPKEDIKPTRVSPNEYKATVVLPIQLCTIDINARTKIGYRRIENMATYAETFLDDEERGKTLPTFIEKILPGIHELKIIIMDKTIVRPINIDSGGHISENIEIEDELAWRLCMRLLQNPELQTLGKLETARQISQALGREDFAQLFEKRKQGIK